MAKVRVLIEVAARPRSGHDGLGAFEAASSSVTEAYGQSTAALEPVAGLDVEPEDDLPPIPLFSARGPGQPYEPMPALSAFADTQKTADLKPTTLVVPAEVDRGKIGEIESRAGVVKVWPNSRLYFHGEDYGWEGEESPFDLARSRMGTDCRPFRPPVSIATVRELLGVSRAWEDGFRGQNVMVAIVDQGINGSVYPVSGGFAIPQALQQPGAAPITSHGSMCAADVLVAAPAATLADYPCIGLFDSGGAARMFTEILARRRLSGAPHIVTNSYGHYSEPPEKDFPGHEVWDINHPFHDTVREVVASGAPVFFSAGNCGSECPDARCHPDSVGPGSSITGANSLAEVVTVAAVNARHERLGYSSQGPGRFCDEKPDLAAYSHFLGNFGPGRPAGTSGQIAYDCGTSASTPLVAGVAALLLSAAPHLSPTDVRNALLAGLTRTAEASWDPGYGRGIVNAAASYSHLKM